MHLSVPGGSVYIKEWNPEQVLHPEPVLLLHDSVGCVGTWRSFPEILAQRLGRRVAAYDRLGFGQSSPRSDLPSIRFISEETDAVLRVLDALQIEKAVLFGYSVGGTMALCAAANAPDRAVAVVSESAQAFVEDRTLRGIEAARKVFGDPQRLEKLRQWHGDQVEWILRAWWDVWTSPAYASWSLAETLPHVKCPVLAIHGDRDEYGSSAFPQMISGLAGGEAEMLLVEDCGHVPHREHLELVLSAVEDFLSRA